MPRIGIVTMVKNECDIIELFLRINFRAVDRIFLIDHMSSDATLKIAMELTKLFPNIEIFHNSSIHNNQSEAITAMVRSVAARELVDYILPLDADEFIVSKDPLIDVRACVAADLAPTEAGLIPWETFCPISLDFFSGEAPLHDCFRRRTYEPQQYYKVILGNEFAKDCLVAMGSHTAQSDRCGQPTKLLNLAIQHVPVRSPEQIIRKALIGSYTMAIRHNRKPGEGFHWDDIANILRNNDFSLDLMSLTSIALNYASPSDSAVAIDVNSGRIGTRDDRIEFSELAMPNLTKDLDRFILDLLRNQNGR